MHGQASLRTVETRPPAGQVPPEPAPRDLDRHVDRLGQVGDLVLALGTRVQRDVVAERAEPEASSGRVGRIGRGRRATDRLGIDPPQEEPDVRDVVAAATGGDPASLERPWQRVERRADPFQAVAIAHRRRDEIAGAPVVHRLVGRQQREVLDHAGIPAGHVPGELFEHRGRALPPPEGDRMGEFGPTPNARRLAVQDPVADEVTDVRQRPRRSGLDELVVVQLLKVLLDDLKLFCEHDEKRRQGPAFTLVAQLDEPTPFGRLQWRRAAFERSEFGYLRGREQMVTRPASSASRRR